MRAKCFQVSGKAVTPKHTKLHQQNYSRFSRKFAGKTAGGTELDRVEGGTLVGLSGCRKGIDQDAADLDRFAGQERWFKFGF